MTREELDKLVKESIARFNALPVEEQQKIRQQQRDGYVKAEMSWPKPKYHWENGIKVYDSLDDYYND